MIESSHMAPRSLLQSVKRGFGRKCPSCGKGRIFRGYIAMSDSCDSCAEPLGRISTADIAPYFTILIVGHIVVPLTLLSEQLAAPPLWFQMTFWPLATLALTFLVLPRVKGAVVGWMWSLRMRGDEFQ